MQEFDDFFSDDTVIEDFEPDVDESQSDGGSVLRDFISHENVNYAFMEVTLGGFNSFQSSALTVAVAELLNQMTDGKLDQFHTKVEAERMLMIAHGNLHLIKLVDVLTKRIAEKANSGTYYASTNVGNIIMNDPTYTLFSEISKEFFQFIIERYKAIYTDACERCGVEPDLDLIENGHYGLLDSIRKYGFENPPHIDENNSTIN